MRVDSIGSKSIAKFIVTRLFFVFEFLCRIRRDEARRRKAGKESERGYCLFYAGASYGNTFTLVHKYEIRALKVRQPFPRTLRSQLRFNWSSQSNCTIRGEKTVKS